MARVNQFLYSPRLFSHGLVDLCTLSQMGDIAGVSDAGRAVNNLK
jgi:hypothetical protein